MDEHKKEEATGAQLQIERLLKLKLEKDKKDKLRMENAGTDDTVFLSEKKAEIVRQKPEIKNSPAAGSKKKPANTITVEKRLYEKLHKLVNAINVTGSARITKAKFVNTVMKEFLALDIDYSLVAKKDEIKRLFERLKKGS